jgi:VWFA-related protein
VRQGLAVRRTRRSRPRSLSLVALAVATSLPLAAAPQTFRSSLDLVSIAVVVRDASGRLVTGLAASDFEVLDAGEARPIAQFRSGDDGDARLALLVDASGSMRLTGGRERTRLATGLLAAAFRPADTASVFSFDSQVTRLTAYTSDPEALRSAVDSVASYGRTSLFDAVVETARTASGDTPRARAVVLLTDGLDTASRHTPDQAATVAARVDLPVYVLGVGAAMATDRAAARAADLAELARRSGGLAATASSPAELSVATRAILDELRAQYHLAVPVGTGSGWHPVEVRVRQGRIQARSRDGYLVP